LAKSLLQTSEVYTAGFLLEGMSRPQRVFIRWYGSRVGNPRYVRLDEHMILSIIDGYGGIG
jgi:hypothetical protein